MPAPWRYSLPKGSALARDAAHKWLGILQEGGGHAGEAAFDERLDQRSEHILRGRKGGLSRGRRAAITGGIGVGRASWALEGPNSASNVNCRSVPSVTLLPSCSILRARAEACSGKIQNQIAQHQGF